MWAKTVLSSARKLVKPSLHLSKKSWVCMTCQVLFYCNTSQLHYSGLWYGCEAKVMSPVILINVVLVLLSNSSAAASSRLDYDLGFMQGWFRDAFIYN